MSRQARGKRGFGYWLKGFLTTLFTAGMILAVAAGGLLWYLTREFANPGPHSADKVVMVRTGMGLTTIGRHLERAGVISDYRIFLAGVTLNKANGRLKAGEYRFKARASMEDVMQLLVSGKSIRHKFTVPEGLTSEQVYNRLNANKVLVGSLDEIPMEGSLLPETYLFQRGLTRKQLVQRMQAAQKKLLDKLWHSRAPQLPFTTRAEAITLASIVEKETGQAAERPRVAGVFVNRLRKSMKLQSDPTIIYGIVGGKGKLGRPIRKSEIDKKTPYNTYQIPGLPPGPIANPGTAAIAAVLNPMATSELYFVADGTGGHVFADTLKQHQKNVAKWRKISRERDNAAKANKDKDSTTTVTPAGAEPAKSN